MQGFKQWCEKCQETKGLHNVCHQQPEKEVKMSCPRGDVCQVRGCGYHDKTVQELLSHPEPSRDSTFEKISKQVEKSSELYHDKQDQNYFNSFTELRREWEEEFDKRYGNKEMRIFDPVVEDFIGTDIKDFIRKTILSERTALVEEIEKMKKEHKSVDMASKYYHEKEGYNQALSDLLSKLREEQL